MPEILSFVGERGKREIVRNGHYREIVAPRDSVVELEEDVTADKLLIERPDGSHIRITLR